MTDRSFKTAFAGPLKSLRLWHGAAPTTACPSRSSVPSLILPIEIWLAILEDLTREEMKSFVSVCKPFRFALFPLFRRTAVIDLSRPWSYIEAPIPIDHRRMVTSLTVTMGSLLQKEEHDQAINLHFSNLADFSNLVEFHWAHRYHMPREIYLFLRSHCSLRILKIENEYDMMSEPILGLGILGLPPPQCALTMASIAKYDIMKDIFRCGSTSHKFIAHLVIHDGYVLQALDAEIAFPSLVHMDLRLTFGTLYLPFLFKLLKSNPTLERITLSVRDANPSTNIHEVQLPELPHLKHFTLEARSHSPFLSLVFGRRTLETLSLGDAFLNREEIQRIHWRGLKVIDVGLEDMAAQNGLIESLSSSGEMAWRKATIRTSVLEYWADNLDVLQNFLTAMANRTNHLTHFYLLKCACCGNRRTNQAGLDALQRVANCLSAFPSWAEVTCSSYVGVSIRFVRGKTGREQYLRVPGRQWLEFEGYCIEDEGWIFRV